MFLRFYEIPVGIYAFFHVMFLGVLSRIVFVQTSSCRGSRHVVIAECQYLPVWGAWSFLLLFSQISMSA